MNRREFLISGAIFAGTAAFRVMPGCAGTAVHRPFTPRFAPHAGTFQHLAGDGLLDQVRFAADHGFAGFEDLRLTQRSAAEQARFGRAVERNQLEAGPFLGYAELSRPTFTSGRSDHRRDVLRAMRTAAECASRTGARWCTVLPGLAHPTLPRAAQQSNLCNLLAECAEIGERSGLGLLVETLDLGPRRTPLAVADLPEAVALCEQIGRPSCRVLFDVYTEAMRGVSPRSFDAGSMGAGLTSLVLHALDRSWSQVGLVQWGDAPGRKEPGTGGLDFDTLLAFLAERRYEGLIGMAHGNSKPGAEGERAGLESYRALGLGTDVPRDRLVHTI